MVPYMRSPPLLYVSVCASGAGCAWPDVQGAADLDWLSHLQIRRYAESETTAAVAELLRFGSVNVNVEPCPTMLSAQMRPPWAATMRSAILRPSPLPLSSRERARSPR